MQFYHSKIDSSVTCSAVKYTSAPPFCILTVLYEEWGYQTRPQKCALHLISSTSVQGHNLSLFCVGYS